MRKILHIFGVVLVWTAFGGGCSDEVPQRAGRASRSYRQTVLQGAAREDLLALVRESAAVEGDGTMKDWLDRQLADVRETVLFPKWDVVRSAPKIYKVRFTFTHLGEENRISQKGYEWTVDSILRVVGETREMRPDEFDPASSRRRGRTHTPDLE